MSSISGLGSVAQTWLTQKVNGANGHKSGDSDGDNDGSSISGTGSSQQGGALMQDVMQSLQGLGLNIPGATNPLTAASSATPGVSATQTDVGQALHTFMHDLHQSLRQMGSAQQQQQSTTADNNSPTNSYS